MSAAERQKRRRDRAKDLRDAAQKPIQSAATQPASLAGQTGTPGSADYPRMLYHPDGSTTVADTPEDHGRLTPDGWGTILLPVHQQRPVANHGTVVDPLAILIRETLEAVLDERGIGRTRVIP
jgi:hypothetical protein